MTNYMYITKDHYGNYVISADYMEIHIKKTVYMFYGKREAVKRFREENGLKRKHFETIEY